MALRFNGSEVGDVTILRLDGRIVLGEESNALREKINAVLAESKRKIILNFDNVTFVDSAGLGTLVSGNHYARHSGAVVKLCHIGKKLREVLTNATKLITVFDVYDTETEALKSFDFPSLYCFCPVCSQQAAPSLIPGGLWARQACTNPACGAQFSIGHSQSFGKLASIDSVTFQTYEKESFEIHAGKPFKILIKGRLDLFSSSALQKSWLAIPSPRRVVFDLSGATEINDAGRRALTAHLFVIENSSKATVSLEGLIQQRMAAFPDGAPFYRSMVDAVRALGDVSDTPSWLARIGKDSRLS